MIEPIIKIRGLTKSFKTYNRPADLVWEALTGRPRHKHFVALDNLNLEIERGTVFGIVGRNGAGKSTLLRIIAGTLDATSGDIQINGRVSAILELGTGFNPDYSGRYNIYLGGLCLGLTRAEIRAREQEIIDFSELGRFIDEPFRHYSSGMQARLAFAVATAVKPDILIIDEALSVGDVKFQKKCFARFEEFRKQGRTILFVSHQAGLVEALCDKAAYIDAGRIKAVGLPRDVVGLYNRDLYGPQSTAPAVEAQDGGELRYGNLDAEIIDCAVLDSDGRRVHQVTSKQRCTIFCRVKCRVAEIPALNVGVSIRTKEGVRLFAADPIVMQTKIPFLHQNDEVDVRVHVSMNFGIGDFFVSFGAWSLFEETHYDRRVDAVHIHCSGAPFLRQSLVNLDPEYVVSAVKISERIP